MACIQGIEEDSRLWAANLPYNDPVWPVAKGSLEQVGETDLTLMGIELGLGGDDMRLLNIEFGDVFKDQNSVTVRDKRGQHIGQSGLTGAGSAGNQEIVAASDMLR